MTSPAEFSGDDRAAERERLYARLLPELGKLALMEAELRVGRAFESRSFAVRWLALGEAQEIAARLVHDLFDDLETLRLETLRARPPQTTG